MIKVAIVADSHYCVDSRFEECVRVHNWIAEDIAQRGVDLCLHAGDVYERRSTPEERRAVAAWAQKVTATCPLVIVRGNHDPIGDLPLLEKLHTLHRLTVVEDARVVEVAVGSAEKGMWSKVVLGCIGWPNKANILALAGAVSREESEQTARDALRDVVRGLGAEMESLAPSLDLFKSSPDNVLPGTRPGALVEREGRAPRILLAHAMVCGSVTSVGQPLVGADLEVALEDLSLAGADLYALGHIHKPQEWAQNDGAPVVYPGSPRRTAFGEVESKGYILATFEGADLVCWERIETPCAPMLLVECFYETGLLRDKADGLPIAFPLPRLRGSEIRIRYQVAPDQREAARAAADMWRKSLIEAEGVAAVKLDERVIAQGSARAPEVAKATTIEEKLARLWEARGTTPDDARAARLVSMAKSIESEAAGAI